MGIIKTGITMLLLATVLTAGSSAAKGNYVQSVEIQNEIIQSTNLPYEITPIHALEIFGEKMPNAVVLSVVFQDSESGRYEHGKRWVIEFRTWFEPEHLYSSGGAFVDAVTGEFELGNMTL